MTKPIMYEVIATPTLEELVEEVQRWVDDNWTPQGGLVICPGGMYAQAMVKYLEDVTEEERAGILPLF